MAILPDDRGVPAYADLARDGDTTKTTVSGTSSAALASGAGSSNILILRMVCDVACYIVTGTSGVAAATTSDYIIPANVPAYVMFDGVNDTHFRVIGTSGSLWWSKVA